MTQDIPQTTLVTDWRLSNAKDQDGFFRGARWRGYAWTADRRQSWRVEVCNWCSKRMWPWDQHEHNELLTLRWQIEQGQVTEAPLSAEDAERGRRSIMRKIRGEHFEPEL